MPSASELVAMRRAREVAAAVLLADGPNPRVGCVILDAAGTVIAEGAHRGAGTPHAEVAALLVAGDAARGGTAVVTLEPCNHTGRTSPCSEALIRAGIARVVFAQPDPHAVASGGAQRLRDAGIDIESEVESDESRALNREWSTAVSRGRPFVTWKVASTLDGRVAAADSTSRWISGPDSRRDVHALRARCDAVVVGTGTVLADDPQLTVRDAPLPLTGQPLRVVVGLRDIPTSARVLDDSAPTMVMRTRDVDEVIAALGDREVRHVMLEGGPTLAAAFLGAGLIDDVVWYVAPMVLGAGPPAVADFGTTTIAEGVRLGEVRVEQIGDDARIVGQVQQREAHVHRDRRGTWTDHRGDEPAR